jgi:hypothetical protein
MFKAQLKRSGSTLEPDIGVLGLVGCSFTAPKADREGARGDATSWVGIVSVPHAKTSCSLPVRFGEMSLLTNPEPGDRSITFMLPGLTSSSTQGGPHVPSESGGDNNVCHTTPWSRGTIKGQFSRSWT